MHKRIIVQVFIIALCIPLDYVLTPGAPILVHLFFAFLYSGCAFWYDPYCQWFKEGFTNK